MGKKIAQNRPDPAPAWLRKLERRIEALENDPVVRNAREQKTELSFNVRSTLGCGPGEPPDAPLNKSRDRDTGLGFSVKSTLGCGPGEPLA